MFTFTEKVTNPSLQELDWSLVFQICDVVNNTELGAKEARKLLQKKMLSNEPQTQVLALEVFILYKQGCKYIYVDNNLYFFMIGLGCIIRKLPS